MIDNMEAGADIHAGDGGYSLGTKEGYDAFVKKRNPMNERIRELWENSDTIEVCYPEQGSPVSVSATTLEKFAELIVRECTGVCEEYHGTAGDQAARYIGQGIKEHFGVKE